LVRALKDGTPFTVARHFDSGVAVAVEDATRRLAPDLIYCDHLSMMAYATRLGRPIVCDTHNLEFQLVRRYARHLRVSPRRAFAAREWRALLRYERRAYRKADLVLAVSAIDARGITALTDGAARVRVVPVGVDVEAIQPVAALTRAPRLLYVGGLHWPPNLDAVDHFSRRILPLVRREVPDAELLIVGRCDVAAAASLGRRAGVRLAGSVPDIGPLFEESRALVVPLRSASGMRVKILDAFARGVPVVSTSLGHEGLGVTPGVELLAAEEPSHFASAVVRVLRDDRLAAALAAAGRRLVLEQHDIRVIAKRLDEAIRSSVPGRGVGRTANLLR
jgi:glycosyltransferase involved in cell wall biosynthesis